jgi:hypothetical protein
MTSNNPIDIQQARELKAAGLPTNLEVETRYWPPKTSELILKVDKAQDKFLEKVMAYNGVHNDRRKSDALVQAWNKLSIACENLYFWANSKDLKKTTKSGLRR